MKKIIDKIANWLFALNERKERVGQDFTTFMKRGNNSMIFGLILFGSFFSYVAFDLYTNYGSLWIALIPIVLFVVFIFAALITKSYKDKLKKHSRNPRMKLVGLNLDFNERVFKRIYISLTQYEYLDENLTSFQDFYNVLVLDFEEHDSSLHFICTQPQLKYILKKFKELKTGISYVSFERSEKVYHKGNLISIDVLHKKYDEFPPHTEFEQNVDAAFKFLGDI